MTIQCDRRKTVASKQNRREKIKRADRRWRGVRNDGGAWNNLREQQCSQKSVCGAQTTVIKHLVLMSVTEKLWVTCFTEVCKSDVALLLELLSRKDEAVLKLHLLFLQHDVTVKQQLLEPHPPLIQHLTHFLHLWNIVYAFMCRHTAPRTTRRYDRYFIFRNNNFKN